MKKYYSPWPNSPSSTGEPRGTHDYTPPPTPSPVVTKPTLPEAIKVVQSAMSEDKGEGSYYYSWQANIAMAFQDEHSRWKELHDNEDPQPSDIHEISNNAAKNFLDTFCK